MRHEGFNNWAYDTFEILQSENKNGYLLIGVRYPNCINFEGKKLLLYKFSGTVEELIVANGGLLDPHFSQTGISPIARFCPSEEGLMLALNIFHYLEE